MVLGDAAASSRPYVQVEDLVRLRNSHRLAFVERLAGESEDEDDDLADDDDDAGSDTSSIADERGRLVRWVDGVPGVSDVLPRRGRKDKEGRQLISSYDDADDDDDDDDDEEVARAAAAAAAAANGFQVGEAAEGGIGVGGVGVHGQTGAQVMGAGELPEGHALVQLVASGDKLVRSVHHLTPVDRTFGPGQVVCWAPGAAPAGVNSKQSGLVESVNKTVIVRRVSDITPATAEHADPATCFEVPAHRLGFFSGVRAGDTVVRGSWVGIIDYFQEDVYVQFADEAIACVPGHRKALQNVDRRTPDRRRPDPFAEGLYYPGQRVRSLPEVWKAIAQWIRGEYTGLDEGVVKSVKVGEVGVEWAAQSTYASTNGKQFPKPVHALERGVEVVGFDEITLLESFRSLWWSVGDRGVLLREEHGAGSSVQEHSESDTEDEDGGLADIGTSGSAGSSAADASGACVALNGGQANGDMIKCSKEENGNGELYESDEESGEWVDADDDEEGDIVNGDEDGEWEEDDTGEIGDAVAPTSAEVTVRLTSKSRIGKRQGGRLMKAQRKARERGGGSSKVETLTEVAVTNPSARPEDVVQVVETKSRATVLWQDGTKTENMPTLNFRVNDHPDPYDFLPGEIVTKSFDALNEEVANEHRENGKVPEFVDIRQGALLRVNQDERTAIVLWAKEQNSTAFEIEDEVSVYELASDHYDVSVGDTVLHEPQDQTVERSLTDWVGVVTKQYMGMSSVVWYGGNVSTVPARELLYITGGDEDDSYESEGSSDAGTETGVPENNVGEDNVGLSRDAAYHHNWGTDNEGELEVLHVAPSAEYGRSIIRDILTSSEMFNPRREFVDNVLAEATEAVSGVIAEEIKEQRYSAVNGNSLLRVRISRTEQRIMASLMAFRVLADACTRMLSIQASRSLSTGPRTAMESEAWERFIESVQDAYSRVLQTEFDWLRKHAGPAAAVEEEEEDLSSLDAETRLGHASSAASTRDGPRPEQGDSANFPDSEPTRFDMVDDLEGFHSNGFLPSGSAPSPGFLSVIHKEWNRLRKHLPKGVLVRACEATVDRLRAGIVGPADTPYEDVLFFFDIRMDHNYPMSPPIVSFWSHGRRLNPNLYEDGKVCLSILGTWSGDDIESWDAKTSNLLRVLLSLQAMVFVEEPYFNEAGYSRQRGTDEGRLNSRIYNESAYLNCIRHVITTFKPSGIPDGCGQMAAEHYRVAGPRILERSRALAQCESPRSTLGAVRLANASSASASRQEGQPYSSAGFRKSLSQLLVSLEHAIEKARSCESV